MSADLLNTYYIGNPNLNNFIGILDYHIIGLFELSISEYTTDTMPEIEGGSVIDVNNNFYFFSANEAISGSPANGTVYVKLVVSGLQVTAEFTATAPTWDADRYGWYNNNDRYVARMRKSGSSYYNKILMNKENYDEI